MLWDCRADCDCSVVRNERRLFEKHSRWLGYALPHHHCQLGITIKAFSAALFIHIFDRLLGIKCWDIAIEKVLQLIGFTILLSSIVFKYSLCFRPPLLFIDY